MKEQKHQPENAPISNRKGKIFFIILAILFLSGAVLQLVRGEELSFVIFLFCGGGLTFLLVRDFIRDRKNE